MNERIESEQVSYQHFSKLLKDLVSKKSAEQTAEENPEVYLGAISLTHLLDVAAKFPASTGRD